MRHKDSLQLSKTYHKARLQVVGYRNIQNRVTDFLSEYSLNTSQWIMLGWLYDNPTGMRVTALAEVLQVETPLITALTQPLQAAELITVTIDKDDKRAKVLQLSPKGSELVDEVDPKLDSHLKSLEAGLKRGVLYGYFETLSQFIDNYKNMNRK